MLGTRGRMEMQRGLRKHKPINKVWNNCLIHTFVCQKRFSSHRIHRLAQRPSPSIICIGSYCTLCAVRCTACECEWEYTVSRMNFMFIFCVSYYLYYSFIYRTVRPTDQATGLESESVHWHNQTYNIHHHRTDFSTRTATY